MDALDVNTVTPDGKCIIATDHSLAFNTFKDLLKEVADYARQEIPVRKFSEEQLAAALLDTDIDPEGQPQKALEPLRMHLYQWGVVADELLKDLNKYAAYPQENADGQKAYTRNSIDIKRLKELYLDAITDIQQVIIAYQYTKDLIAYHKQCRAAKWRHGAPPAKPQCRRSTIGRNPNISLFDRMNVIKSLCWIEWVAKIEYLNPRDIRPHTLILARQCLELAARDAIGYFAIVDHDGQELKKFTQIGWKFINQFKVKGKDAMTAKGTDNSWSITLPVPVTVLAHINSNTNHFTHNPFINRFHVQWYQIDTLMKLTAPATSGRQWTTRHGDIHISGLKALRAEFEAFVAKQDHKASVIWQPENYAGGAFIDSLGETPSKSLLLKFRRRQSLRNLKELIKATFSELSFFTKSFWKR
ncbi:MAG: hypothetical protein K2F87_01055 [Muribaculaceae bacterium]|nr:hypothetical protein [Muribaculaceae bacterium]